jgi:hypothetical protein
VFLSADAKRELLSKEHSIERDVATRIQSQYRRYKAYKVYVRERAAARISAAWRGHVARQAARQKKEALLQMQAAVRMWRAKAHVDKTRKEFTQASIVVSDVAHAPRPPMTCHANPQPAPRLLTTPYSLLITHVCVAPLSWQIEAHVRAALAKRERARRMRAIVKIQALWRGYIARSRFNQLVMGRMVVNSMVAKPFLRPGEAVVLCGAVLKRARHISLKAWGRRILVLTTAPRLLYISKDELRGEIPYTTDDQVCVC